MENDPICFGVEASGHIEEGYLNYEGSEDLLYGFRTSSEGNVYPLKAEEEDVEILGTFAAMNQSLKSPLL